MEFYASDDIETISCIMVNLRVFETTTLYNR